MEAVEALSSSLEDYLEAIYQIVADNKVARSKEIARRLQVKGASVTGALRALAKRDLINYAPYEVITLTAVGEELARDVVRRHEVLKDFFTKVLAVDPELAEVSACKMEHAVGREIVDALVEFAEFVDVCPRGGGQWTHSFARECWLEGSDSCVTCLEDTLTALRGVPAKKRRKVRETPFSELKPGQKARILKVRAGGPIRKRIADMGLSKGVLVEVERVAPLGDPMQIKVRGYHLSLRKSEVDGITVEIQ